MKRIFKDGVWTIQEDPVAKTDGKLSAPLTALKEEAPVPLPEKLPFKRILNNHLIIHIDPYKRARGTKVHVPDNAKRSPTKGTVIAIADNILDIKIGDKILYSQFAGYFLAFEGFPPLRSISYEEVLLILENDAPDLLMEGV